MSEITFFSHKIRKERSKYIFVFIFALFMWVTQVSVINKFLFLDTTLNLILLSNIYFGLIFGPYFGMFYGITSSFFISSILYDHTFLVSYPLIGLLAGLLKKNIFSDELLFYMILSFLFTLVLELLNGWQYGISNSFNLFERYFLISFNGALINLCIAPVFYIVINYITKKLNIRQ
ncbi:MAG: hypothetical protein HYY52_02065 [Candidatus Melainabacteria bacterium]|nr:hypothetical protein [Candidatus Melainabacteria bacterium]